MRPIDILKQSRKSSLTLILGQAIIIRISPRRKHPPLILIPRRIPTRDIFLTGNTINARVAREDGARLTQTPARGEHFLDQRGERGVLGARAVEDGAEEEYDDCAAE